MLPALAVLVVVLASAAMLGARPAEASTAAKSCVVAGTNLYTCTLTITPSVVSSGGNWLVQLVPGPGTLVGTPSVESSTGCTPAPTIGSGSFISSVYGNADYDVVISGTCATGSVTASGSSCQRVWVNTASPFVTACESVNFTTSPTPTPAAPTASKVCTAQSTPNVYTCAFTVTPASPARRAT